MRITPLAFSALAAPLLIASLAARQQAAADQFWPQWRGPQGTGVSATARPPIERSETKNIRWKGEIPGGGWAPPVFGGDGVSLFTPSPFGVAADSAHAPRGSQPVPHTFLVLAIDR